MQNNCHEVLLQPHFLSKGDHIHVRHLSLIDSISQECELRSICSSVAVKSRARK